MTVNEEGATVPRQAQSGKRAAAKDKKVVDVDKAALVDPNLHTDTRMRLHRTILKILGANDRAAGRRSGPE